MIMIIIVIKKITNIIIKEIIIIWIETDMMIRIKDIIISRIDQDPEMILVEVRTTSGLTKEKKLKKDTQVIPKVRVDQVLLQVPVQVHPVPHQATNHKVNLLK